MALSDDDVERQILHMIAFIDQEAKEKVEEIDVKAEEEYNIEKGKIVNELRVKILEYFEKQEKMISLQKRIQFSNMLSRARLSVLQKKHNIMRELIEETYDRLKKEVEADKARYASTLKDLILQGLFMLVESKVELRCRRQDVNLIKSMLESIKIAYKNEAGISCDISIDGTHYLSGDDAGGVQLFTHKEKISVDNTLRSRMEMIFEKLLPEIREELFGPNESRKFRD